jgi:hypothetical protein
MVPKFAKRYRLSNRICGLIVKNGFGTVDALVLDHVWLKGGGAKIRDIAEIKRPLTQFVLKARLP